MKIQKLSGIFIFLSLLLTIISYFYNKELFIYSGVFAWLALIISFKNCSNKKLLISLIFISFICFIYSFFNDFTIDYLRAITVNQYLLALIIGVGFLKLIATPKNDKIKNLPTGKKAFLKTYWGIHLFGSVINLTSLILVADKLNKKAKLTSLQVLVITRAFSSDAFWSPFFVAFAAVHTYAGNLSSKVALFSGIVLAWFTFLITYYDVTKSEKVKEFNGYPIHFETLYIPFILAILVLYINHYYPDIKVIMIIASLSFLLTLIILPVKIGIINGYKKLGLHISDDLLKMKNELSLFLIAGFFGVSISTVLSGLNIDFPIDNIDGFSSSIMLLIIILLSFIGIHPIISIAIIGSWTTNLNSTLLAVTFLMSWSISVCSSPFSGVNLTMQARYSLKAMDLFKLNITYALRMYLLCVITLFILSKYLGL